MTDIGRSAAVRPITCQIGSTVFDDTPSSNRLRNSRPVRSVALSPGFSIASTSAMAASLIVCARRMHSISSAVLTTLAVTDRHRSASTSSRSSRAARSGMVRSSTARRPGGNDFASTRGVVVPFEVEPAVHVLAVDGGGTPSGYGVYSSGGAPSTVTPQPRAGARRGRRRPPARRRRWRTPPRSGRPRAARPPLAPASARRGARDARRACVPCRAACRTACSSRQRTQHGMNSRPSSC